MYFPIYHIPEFYSEPQKVIDWVNTLEFLPTDGNYPGKRTDLLHEIAPKFFNYSVRKILNMIYGNQAELDFKVGTSFQKISYNDIKNDNNNGWIHADTDSFLTVIIYLTPGLENSGTSIYKPINEGHGTELELSKERRTNYLGKKIDKNKYLNDLENNNSNFELISTMQSKFNSAIAFDGCHPHGAHFNLKPGETRLTQTMFFKKMHVPYYPMVEIKRNNY